MAERWRDVCGVRIAPAELRFSAVPGSRHRAGLTVQNLRAGACHLRLLPPHQPQFKLIVENPEKPIASGLQVKAVVEYTPKCAEDLQDKLTLLIDDDVVHIPVLGAAHGLIPYCDLEIESEVNFGEMIANNKLVTKEISISNRGTISGQSCGKISLLDFHTRYFKKRKYMITETRSCNIKKKKKQISV